MEYKFKLGDFNNLGAIVKGKAVTFTFQTNTLKDCYIHLYDTSSFKEVDKIKVDPSFAVGYVYSIEITGINLDNTCYLLERDGKIGLDEYARLICGREKWNDNSRISNEYRVFCGFQLKQYAFKDQDRKLLHPDDAVIYKLHMRGISMKKGKQTDVSGTYKSLIKLLPDIKDMGFNVLEFLPLYEFEEVNFKHETIIDAKGKYKETFEEGESVNYWGYGSGAYFAPKASYFGGKDADIHMKEMVQAIHAKDMDIVMEMTFDQSCSDDFILTALRYWVREYHIDGFHLTGIGLPIERIAADAMLKETKIFYNHFTKQILEKEKDTDFKHLIIYDDSFIYPLRKLQNHMDGSIIDFANQMKKQNKDYGFVDYSAYNTTGFTLSDVYSYSEKHNEANGEENRDGNNFNFSHNYGTEGETNSRNVTCVRMQHIRTALAATILSQSIPLICAGDEIGNSQEGNNNAYCQDNEVGWVSYPKKMNYKKLKGLTKDLIDFRNQHSLLKSAIPYEMTDYLNKGMPDLSYHGKEPWVMWLSENMKSIGMFYYNAYGKENEEDVMLLFNFYFDEEHMALPSLPEGRAWFRALSTADDHFVNEENPVADQSCEIVPGGTMTILVGKPYQSAKEQESETEKPVHKTNSKSKKK